jgi:hypothetical protein
MDSCAPAFRATDHCDSPDGILQFPGNPAARGIWCLYDFEQSAMMGSPELSFIRAIVFPGATAVSFDLADRVPVQNGTDALFLLIYGEVEGVIRRAVHPQL